MSSSFKKLIFCCLVLWAIAAVTMGQHSPYSLQAAVDALHRRELQLALKDNYNNPRTRYAPPVTIDEDDYWDGIETEGPSDRRRLNKLLARYLQNEEDNEMAGGGESYENDFDDENFIPIEERKRSFFRENERNEPQYMGSVFREREFPRNNQQELTEKFLREIEEERDLEREERYKEALKNLWEKYQQQENEIEDELFEDEKRKRFLVPESDAVGNQYIGPLMQRKRSYPVLPWLPYNKKKRFPVAKRSPKMPMKPFSTSNEANGNDQISKDLQAIFGPTGEEKKKRSVSPLPSSTSSETTVSAGISTTISTDKSHEDNHIQEKRNAKPVSSNADHSSHNHHGEHHQASGTGDHRHHNDDSSESRESEEEHIDESHEEEHEDQSHEHVSEEEDDEKKKKRSVADKKNIKKTSEVPAATKKKRANLEVVKEDQIIPGDLESPKKKSIDWSNYFGLDRRKKSIFPLKKSKKMVPLKKRSPIDLLADEKRRKRNFSEEKLDQMDSKLKSIEDLIIDETIKYTGAHEGIRDPEKIRELKDHVLSRLATAYNLEKMRRALEKLRESVENENHLSRNEIEALEDDTKEREKAAAAKRLSVKKEKVEFENEHRQPDTSEKQTEGSDNNLKDDDDEERKRKKKRNGGGSIRFSDTPNELSEFEEELGAGHFEPHNDVYLGRQNNGPLSINQCPIIDSMSERCRNVDILSGDIHQDLLPICGVHELCYLCGISPVACDLQYLSDADSICGHNSDCQSAARSVLMILRGTPGPQLGPKECLKNPCLYRVMREIGL
ncbi:trichohyalin [Condylostylus longicornis]|uniref:trichohyalin n=1 Tax=Condylostylus longicornis TaxID=2530218 RepID=UPI00244E4400|nr:trichohyalin [Condylostylus longicornis]XP_055379433.1 trichohyalin [Condylostylus longicornis]XP_055379435.1 trichohyalin [Condylostylus longicornis]XP_055379436.1 trichohyalin [Condylostylus longicornis]XP_055379437.1 trichohyalin [Condylostylus longicornis]XP_055379438.1 trichohyalin [Condylostylus longicornis]